MGVETDSIRFNLILYFSLLYITNVQRIPFDVATYNSWNESNHIDADADILKQIELWN